MSDPVSGSSTDHAEVIRADNYRRLYETSAIGIFRSTPDGGYVMANPAGVRMHGYDSEAELLRAVRNIAGEVYVDPEDREAMRQLLVDQGFVEGFECEIYRHRSKERLWVRQNVYRVTDEAGRLWYLEGYVEDITDRKRVETELRQAREELESNVAKRTAQLRAANQTLRTEITERKLAEQRLRDSEENLRKVVAQAGDGLFIVDPANGRLVDVNNQACASLGYTREELLDLSVPDIDTEFPEERFHSLITSLERGETVTIVGTHRRKDGTVFPVEIRTGLIELQGRSRLLALARDVTEQRQAEERLRQALKMETVGQLTGGVAHDFNNLLAVIMGNTELLGDELGANNASLDAIFRAATRGAELTQRLLAFSRQQPLEPRAIDLAVLVSGMSELLTRTLGETIEVMTSMASALWQATADPGQVENALLNLALNARDAMPGGGRLTIECANVHLDEVYVTRNPEAVAGSYAVLAVSDNGTGMTADVQAQAFEPFFTTKEVGRGSGLGLSMVYGFAKQSGGHVAIYSEEGRGTTVKLYLPRAEGAAEPEDAPLRQGVAQGRGEMILVIEDDPDVRTLAVAMVGGLGYRAIAVADAAAAHEALAGGKAIDLVLSDVVLPGGTSGVAQ